jgi:serine phosphatase RsbU (regulator of sigma subunit)
MSERPVLAPTAVDLSRVFDALASPYVVMDRDLVVVAVNEAYLRTTGRTREGLLGRWLFESFPPPAEGRDAAGRPPVQVTLERVRDSGRPETMEVQRYGIVDLATGAMTDRHWMVSISAVLDGDNRTVLLVQRSDDVTDFVQERELGRLARKEGDQWRRRVEAVEADLFARAQELSAVLEAKDLLALRLASLALVSAALTTAETVEDLERIVVGGGLAGLGADGGAVISPEQDGGWRVTVNASLGEQVQMLYGHVPYDSPLPACWTARTGERLLLPDRASGLAFHPVMDSVYIDTLRAGWAFLPLKVREERLGTLAVAWIDEHPFPIDEIEVLEGFAAQCAQALVRIRVTQAHQQSALEIQRMSETLQRSLLTQPPGPPWAQIAVRYQPSAVGVEVGGDWHDAFLTASGALLLVVGDVFGHDRTSAATMGQLRNLLRGLAYDSHDGPAALLTRLDAAMAGLALDTLATAVVVRIEPAGRGGWRMSWSSAGHPPALLRHPDGAVTTLQCPPGQEDLLLGLDALTVRHEQDAPLPPGATLLLFSDGLVERRNAHLDDGLARLAGLLAGQTSEDVQVICEGLLASVVGLGNDDDIALLALRLDGDGAARRRFPSG